MSREDFCGLEITVLDAKPFWLLPQTRALMPFLSKWALFRTLTTTQLVSVSCDALNTVVMEFAKDSMHCKFREIVHKTRLELRRVMHRNSLRCVAALGEIDHCTHMVIL